MPFCGNCGASIEEGLKFCPSCGRPVAGPAPAAVAPAPTEEERAFFKGEGELVIKRTKHHGAGRKMASWLALGPVGYVAFGRDKTKKGKAQGSLVVTNKALYCAGNEYPFDKIVGLTKEGTIHKSVMITFEKSFSEPGTAGVGGVSYEVELKTRNIDELFRALEQARLSKVKF